MRWIPIQSAPRCSRKKASCGIRYPRHFLGRWLISGEFQFKVLGLRSMLKWQIWNNHLISMLGAIALLNVVYDGFLILHGTKKLWIVHMYEDLMTDKNIKKQLPGILRFLIKLFQIILYIPIQIIFIPFAIGNRGQLPIKSDVTYRWESLYGKHRYRRNRWFCSSCTRWLLLFPFPNPSLITGKVNSNSKFSVCEVC